MILGNKNEGFRMTTTPQNDQSLLPCRRFTIVLLGVGAFLIGCDLPDRHDIAMFRKPASWELTSSGSTASSGLPDSGNPTGNLDPAGDSLLNGSLTSGDRTSDSDSDEWQIWYLHHVAPDYYLGGGVMQSQRVTESGVDQIRVILTERTLVPSQAPDDPPSKPPAESPRWQPNRFECLTANEQTFWHATDGRLIRAECQVRRGPLQMSKNVEVEEEQVRFDVDHLTSKEKKRLAHRGELRGPLAVYQSLLGNPMALHQSRRSTVLLPIQECLAELEIRGRRDALIQRFTGEGLVLDSLHEAVALVSIGDSARREQYYWYDDRGVVQTTNITGERRFTYRCDEKQYTSLGQGFLNQAYPITVEVPGKPIPAGEIKQLAWKVERSPYLPELEKTPRSEDPSVDLSIRSRVQPAPRQYIRQLDATHQRVITTDGPVSAEKLAGRFEPHVSRSTAADLAVTTLVDFNSPAVRKMLQISAAMKSFEDRELAVELNGIVHSLLSFEPLSVGIRPASSIASSPIADSTEHAILLISMLRARNIPARMVLGIRHLPRTAKPRTDAPRADAPPSNMNRFVYHAWVMAKCEDEWISLDATSGKETSAGCLSLKTDDLSALEANRFVDDYLAVLRCMKLSVAGAMMK